MIKRLIALSALLLSLNGCQQTTVENNQNSDMKKQDISLLGKEDAFQLIGKEWMLITAGDSTSYNTMTASWGGIGWLWNKPVAFIFVRPERYTHEFIEKNVRLTLSFFPEDYRSALQICGSKSGRDCDKVKEAGISPKQLESGAITFNEARMALDCRKLFKAEMEQANFLDKELLEKWYHDKPGGGFHTVYVVEIENVYAK